MQNIETGELTRLDHDDPRITNPPEGHVILHGKEEDIQRIATDVQRRVDIEAKRRKRKAQKAARRKSRG
jgi:hypothetical protein